MESADERAGDAVPEEWSKKGGGGGARVVPEEYAVHLGKDGRGNHVGGRRSERGGSDPERRTLVVRRNHDLREG